MSPKAKPSKLDPLDVSVVHVFHVRGPQFGRHSTLFWRLVTCDGRYRAIGSTKDEAVERITSLMSPEREVLGLITYRHVCEPSEARAEIVELRRQWETRQRRRARK